MHFPTLKRLAGSLAVLSLTAQTVLARPCAEPAMLIFDGSGSMAEAGSAFASASRIRDAQGAVGQVMPEVAPFRDIGLLVYGPGSSDGCDGISLALEPREDMALEIITEVNGIRPDGLTPLRHPWRRPRTPCNIKHSPLYSLW
ncbi:hypothetical protein ACS3SW_15385 [Roseobacteraceae bacterium S113]